MKYINKMLSAFRTGILKDITDSKHFVFIVSGILGAIFFMYFFGVRVLDPTYVDWFLTPMYSDRFQHYLGWVAYRNSDWYFPIGLHHGSTYPLTESVMYTDAIPIIAIPFKALSPVLPQTFQYFGWVGLLWYFLQGGFGGLIVKKISGYTSYSIICSTFFTMSSFMAYRMLNHTALAAHFLILAAIYLCLTKDEGRSTLRNCVLWGILLGFTTGVSIYLLAMVFVIMCFYYLDDLFEYKKFLKTTVGVVVPVLAVFIVLFFIGFFHSSASNSQGGLGDNSTNLNQLINSNASYADIGASYSDFSRIIKPLPLVITEGWETSSKQTEGNVYLGLGMIIFLLLALFAFFDDFRGYKDRLSDKRTLRRVIFTIVMFIAFYIVALSPRITLNDRVLFDYRQLLPGKVIILWDIFRGTGRFVWTSAYILMITAIWAAVKMFKKSTLIFIAVILVLIQYQDVTGFMWSKGENFRKEQVYVTDLQSELWDNIARDFNHMFYVGGTVNRDSILKFAVHNGMTVNDTYLARKDIGGIEAYKNHVLNELHEGHTEPDFVYIFEDIPADLILRETLYVYMVNGMIIGTASRIENAEYIADVIQIRPEDIAVNEG